MIFTNYLSYEKHFSPHTITAYTKDLQQFASYLTDQFEITETRLINHQMVRSWLVQLMNDKVSSRSVGRKLSTLKTFYKFLLKEGIVEVSPLAKVQPPKMEKRLPVFVEENHMQRPVR
jgi:integrase/recombinase XerC